MCKKYWFVCKSIDFCANNIDLCVKVLICVFFQIMKMSEQTGLPPKVIKHWFRNTLFKERQRNKDSPYNFSVPPSTQLNLEEYEKTGTWKLPVSPANLTTSLHSYSDSNKDIQPTPNTTYSKYICLYLLFNI